MKFVMLSEHGSALRTSSQSAQEPLGAQEKVLPLDYAKHGIPPEFPPGTVTWDGRKWSPNGVIYENSSGKPIYHFMHTPKTAGCSWSRDILSNKVLPQDNVCWTAEPQSTQRSKG